MVKKIANTNVTVILLVVSVFAAYCELANAGSLEPTAAPGPTMKTLDEVEPRVPIHASDLPLTITEPNSYYLVEDVSFTDKLNHAITIECNDVTIDLSGFSVTGPGSGTSSGIYMNSRRNVEIRNGTIRDFEYGIHEEGQSGKNHRVIDVRAISNSVSGIYLVGIGHLVKDCTASDNGNAAASTDVRGIFVGSSSTVTGNMVNGNGTSATGGNNVYGIHAQLSSRVTGNTVNINGGDSNANVYGISAGDGSTVTGNTASGNGYLVVGTVKGIYANTGSTVTGNTVRGNGYSATNVRGIHAGRGCTVTGNTAHDNGTSATGDAYGIYLVGSNLVDQNTAYDNGLGAGSATEITYGVAGCVYGINVPPAP